MSGIISSMPIAGPTSVVMLSRSLQGLIMSSRIVAAGAACGEAMYACMASYGFSSYLSEYPVVLALAKALAAVLFTTLGLVLFLKSNVLKLAKNQGGDVEKGELAKVKDGPSTPRAVLALFSYGFGLTGLNPALIVSWTGIIGVLSPLMKEGSTLAFGLGVCAGIQLWFNFFLSVMSTYRHLLKPETIARALRGIGLLLLLVGIFLLLQILGTF